MSDNKHFLQDYREHKIYYNEDTDKFTVELLVDDDWREKSRKSMKDCKKAIDDHIKANYQFKPVKCIRKRYSNTSAVTIKQVRADGGFVIEVDGKLQTEISEVLDQLKGREKSYFNYNPDYVEWLVMLEELRVRHQREYGELRKKEPQLTPLDLTFVKEITNIQV